MKKDWKKYIGTKFGRLLILDVLSPDSNNKGCRFICRCDCGKEKEIAPGSILKDETKYRVVRSCGCLRKESYGKILKDITGRRFGRLVVIGRNKLRYNHWSCKCDCGVEKSVFRGHLMDGLTKSCGCMKVNGDWIKRGPQNALWKSEMSMVDRIRNKRHFGLKAGWRREVLNRDDHACRKCGTKTGKLQAHHIESWVSCPERRNDVSNGGTLCFDCHNEFHRIYGKGMNTREQFEEFTRIEYAIQVAI